MLLRMCPETWQDHYATTQQVVPQDSRKLLLVLENIEKLCATTNANKPAGTANGETVPRKVSVRVRTPTQLEFQKRSASKNTVPCARNMGARQPRTILASVPSTRRMGLLSPHGDTASLQVSPPRKGKARPLRSWQRPSRNLRRPLRNLIRPLLKRRNVTMTVTVVPIPNRKLG